MTDRLTLRRIIPSGGTQDHVIAEPGGWVGHTIKLERHKEFHSVIETIFSEGKFIFVGDDHIDGPGGADFIRTVEQEDGVDAEIQFIAETAEDDVNFETYFIGQLQLEGLEELPDNEVEVPVIRDDFWSKFLRHYDTPVDLTKNEDLFGNAVDPAIPISVQLTPQIVRQKAHFTNDDSVTYGAMTATEYGQIDWGASVLDEIEEKIYLSRVQNPVLPQANLIMKYAGEYTFDVSIPFTLGFLDEESNPSWEGLLTNLVYIKFDDETPIAFTRTNGTIDGHNYSIYTYSGTKSLNAGSSVRIYIDPVNGFAPGVIEQSGLVMLGNEDVSNTNQIWQGEATLLFTSDWLTLGENNYLKITGDTIYPETEVQGYFAHDLAAYIIARMGLGDGFYSEYLGNENTNARQYDESGCASRFFVTKGLFIRGYTLSDNPDDPTERYSLQEKGFQLSFKDWWEGMNPIFCLGLGYENLEDSPEQQVIRVEDREYFYNSTSTSLNFNDVYDISRNYDKDLIFKSVRSGYKRWESEKASSIDDPQTKHTRTIPFKHVGKELILESEFIAASLAWETTRRMSIEKSSDYKLDNNNFILAINIDDVTPEESPELYIPELDENFNSVTNLLSPETRYNLILTPLRNFLRHAKYILGCMQSYLTASIKFNSGEGNYDMTSDYNCGSGQECLAVICDAISESDDIDLSVYGASIGYYHLPMEYPINLPMTWEEYKTLNQYRHISFGISKTDTGHTKFFIKECTFNKRDGQAELLGWPQTFFNVNPEEGESGSEYDEDLQDILDFAEDEGYTLPSDEVLELLDDLVTDLKALDVWQDLDLLYIFSTDGDEDFATLNLVNPATFKASRVNSPMFLPNIGFEGNGTDQYLTTGWDPATNAVHFTLNEGGAFSYCHTDISATNDLLFGSQNATNGRIQLIPKSVSSNHIYAINSAGTDAVGTTVSSQGFFHIRRTATNDLRLYKNGAQVGTTEVFVTSDVLCDEDIYLLANNGNGTPGNHIGAGIGVFGIGASFAGKEQELNDIFNTYIEAVALLPAGAFTLEDDSGFIALENNELLIKEN